MKNEIMKGSPKMSTHPEAKWCPFCGQRQSKPPVKPMIEVIEVGGLTWVFRCFRCDQIFRVCTEDQPAARAMRRRG